MHALDGVLECSRTWDRVLGIKLENGVDIMIIPVDYYHQSCREEVTVLDRVLSIHKFMSLV